MKIQLTVTGTDYSDTVLCYSFDEVIETLLANFYDAYGMSLPAHYGEIIPELLTRGYSINLEVVL